MSIHILNLYISAIVSFQRDSTMPGKGYGHKVPEQAVDGNNDTCARIMNVRVPAWWRVWLDDYFYIHRIIINFNQNTSGSFFC